MNRTQRLLVALTALAIPLSFLRAPYPSELVLQHAPTLVGIAALVVVMQRFGMSRLSFGCVLAFLWLHIIGARWIYSYVPYDELAEWLTGSTLSEWFGWRRNHYDRLVHFASGVLGAPIASEALQRVAGMKPRGAAVMSVAMVLAVGALYEIFEWQIAVLLAPSYAEAYNGQQGDVWDPQKDLALAGVGAAVSALLLQRWKVAPGLRGA